MIFNCRPGDLARVISDAETQRAGIVDKIVRVDRMEILPNGYPAWSYEGPQLRCACPCQRPVELIGDAILRPIRGQEGDDEMLRIAGRPATRDALVAA